MCETFVDDSVPIKFLEQMIRYDMELYIVLLW